jgi:putative exporter of polyketide antibiotics
MFSFLNILFFNITMIIKNFSYAYEGYKLDFSFTDIINTIYDVTNTFSNFYTLLFLIISIIVSSFNISLLLKYIKIIKKANESGAQKLSVKKLGIGMTLAMLATHCASCGAALFGGLISLSFLSYLPFAGYELGLLGIIVLIYTSYDIIKKLNNPYVC